MACLYGPSTKDLVVIGHDAISLIHLRVDSNAVSRSSVWWSQKQVSFGFLCNSLFRAFLWNEVIKLRIHGKYYCVFPLHNNLWIAGYLHLGDMLQRHPDRLILWVFYYSGPKHDTCLETLSWKTRNCRTSRDDRCGRILYLPQARNMLTRRNGRKSCCRLAR